VYIVPIYIFITPLWTTFYLIFSVIFTYSHYWHYSDVTEQWFWHVWSCRRYRQRKFTEDTTLVLQYSF